MNPLEEYFKNNTGRRIFKWMHYFEHYHTHFAKYRRTADQEPVKILEIGVYFGGSTQMWANYFGNCQVIGIDIDPQTQPFEEKNITLEIGDQADRDFLQSIIDKHGPFDVIIDDGGHRMKQQITSIEMLWDSVKPGGIYLCEDTHTSYWPEYQDKGYSTFIQYSKNCIDTLHAYHHHDGHERELKREPTFKGMHVYDSMIFFDKSSPMPIPHDEYSPPFPDEK
jgi:cephalosporin hydroxylase